MSTHQDTMLFQTTAIMIFMNLMVCCLFVLSETTRKGSAVLQVLPQKKQAKSSSSSELRELKIPFRELIAGSSRPKSSSFKRYHEIEKPKFLPYTQTPEGQVRKPDAGPAGKISYEIKVYIPRHPESGTEPLDKSSFEIAPARFEPMEYSVHPYSVDERPHLPPPPTSKYDTPRTSYMRPFNGPNGRITYETKPGYVVPVYSEEIPHPEKPPGKSHSGERESNKLPPPSRYAAETYQSSSESKYGEENSRPMTYVEVKAVKQGEPAYPPSYKPKSSRYSAEMPPSYDSRETLYRLDVPPDYIPYDQQQTTDPPVPADKEMVYYEKSQPEPMNYDYSQRSKSSSEVGSYEHGPQRSRPPVYGMGYGGYGGSYQSHPPPPPPPTLYQPSYFYYYPQPSSYGQHHGYSQAGGNHQPQGGGQYRHQPRPIYSGYGYAAYAPYKR